MKKEVIDMRDFPVFNTEFGVASLVLKEIPYQGKAYVTLRSSLEPEKLLEECVSFCRICGAETVYATGECLPDGYPLYTAMLCMRCGVDTLADTDAALFPVQQKTLAQWRQIYNTKVKGVPAGAWMTEKDAQAMLEDGSGYFVHRGDTLLGIGKVSGSEIQWVASLVPGAGREVVCALAHAVIADVVELTVASTNTKALELYESLGFFRVREQSRWYVIYNSRE
jgi:hypothetical protein